MSDEISKELQESYFKARDHYKEIYDKEAKLREYIRESSIEGRHWYEINSLFDVDGLYGHWRTKYKTFGELLEAERQAFEALENTDRYKEWIDIYKKEKVAKKLYLEAKMKYSVSMDS